MNDKIFFSYSRFDSAFVLRLASDLRNAGAGVWLDHLDISPGKRWDSEIEQALNEANCVLAILSPKSLASDNVMDEISYALEEKKKVIPVLLTSTETPFRLRRLQRIDFTGDYDTGFRQLLLALKLEKPELSFPAKGTMPQAENDNIQANKDQELWDGCCAMNTAVAYQQYLRTTASKQHLDEAWYRLDVLQEKPMSRAIRLPQSVKNNSKKSSKKNIMLAALLIPVAAIAFGTFKIINKGTPAKNTELQAVHSIASQQNNVSNKTADTTAGQAIQAQVNNNGRSPIEPPHKPVPDRIIPVQKTSKKNTSSAELNNEDIRPVQDTMEESPPVSTIETTSAETPITKKKLVINSRVVVNLVLLDNPDMHERKKTDQPVRFSVTNNVMYEGEVIIRKGATAKGSLTIGRIQTDIRITKVDGINGNVVYLRSEKEHGRRNEVETKRNYTAIIKEGTQIEY
jgi:hypothetical protein